MESDDEEDLILGPKIPKYIKYPGLLDSEYVDRDLHELPPKKCEPSQCQIHGKRFPCGIKDLKGDASPPADRTPKDRCESERTIDYPAPPPLDFCNLSQASIDILLKQTELLDLLTLQYCGSDVQNQVWRMKRKMKWMLLDTKNKGIYIKEEGCTCWIEKQVRVEYGDSDRYADNVLIVRTEQLTARVISATPDYPKMVHRLTNLFAVPSFYLRVYWDRMIIISPFFDKSTWPFTDLLVIGDGENYPGTGCMALLKSHKTWRNVIFEGVHFSKTFRDNEDVIGGFFHQFLENDIENIIFRDCGLNVVHFNKFMQLWMKSTNTTLRKFTMTFMIERRTRTGITATANMLEGLSRNNECKTIGRVDGEYKINDPTVKPLICCHFTREDGMKASVVQSEVHHNTKTFTFLVHPPEAQENDSGSDSEAGPS